MEVFFANFMADSYETKTQPFQVITTTRSLVLCAESRREMEDWLAALKAASLREYYEPGLQDTHDFLANHHHWFINNHHRPTYCNVCRDLITSHGLSCEVCKCKVHKRCAAKAIANCKWTTLATVGREIIEDVDGNIIMPHQWMEGNLPVSSSCLICKRTCGSVLRLQDWRCLWCRATAHTACRPFVKQRCPLGSAQLSVIPPTSVHSIGIDEAWDVVKPNGSYSPLLVFVNSKSGDNQGVKFLRRFKQILNPAQVFDLVSAGPGLGLRLFRHFEPFRILVCSGDGSVGWVLSEIDRMDMIKKCQLAVLPLGTGNDLARVLGWGSSCDDDAHLPQILERYEKASTKMLDRWSIMVFEKEIESTTPGPTEKHRRMSTISNPSESILLDFVDTVNSHLSQIVDTDDFHQVIHSTKHLCDTIYKLLARVSVPNMSDDQMTVKCDLLKQKLDMLLDALKEENASSIVGEELTRTLNDLTSRRHSVIAATLASELSSDTKTTNGKTEKDKYNTKERRNSRYFVRSGDKEAIQTRANSLKRAISNVVEASGIYDHKPRHGSRKHSLVALNIPGNIGDTSDAPMTSPPIVNIISPSSSQTHLATTAAVVSCLSPLPDQRRSSMDEYFFSSVNLPVPKQFADGSSRRSSGVPEAIKEDEDDDEDKWCQMARNSGRKWPQMTANGKKYLQMAKIESDSSTRERIELFGMAYEKNDDDETNCVPDVVYERNLLRTSQQHAIDSHPPTIKSNTLQVPVIPLSELELMERSPSSLVNADNVYTSDNMTIIDTDPMPGSISEDNNAGEASDILSAISNEECSVTSEILDKQPELDSHIHAAEIIQDLESDRLGHIDSPEDVSDMTEVLQGESLLDDISSVLGHDLLGAIQDNSITDDTTTLCGSKPPRRLSKKKPKELVTKELIERADSLENSNENPLQFGFENIVFEMDNRCDDQKSREPVRYCSLAQFVEGNDIARKSFKRPTRNSTTTTITTTPTTTTIMTTMTPKCADSSSAILTTTPTSTCSSTSSTIIHHQSTTNTIEMKQPTPYTPLPAYSQPLVSSMAKHKSNAIKIQIQGSQSNINGTIDNDVARNYRRHISFDDSCKKDDGDEKHYANKVSVVVEPPSPEIGNSLRVQRLNEIRRHSSHSPSLTVKEYDGEKDRRHSGANPNTLGLDSEHMRFLNCSPAASRRISCGSLFKPNEAANLCGSKSSLFTGSTLGFNFDRKSTDKDDSCAHKEKLEKTKKLPIINPLVRLPSWPNVTGGTGFISKCLLANADTLCAAVSPLMDPDETLMEGYYEKCVMNNYFGIGIDAKISLDFHMKREEHPEKCRSRAKNYMWYGVLGSKQFLQKTYKNLEQRVQLECDGQRIPLPSLQGIVILNIPSFMGGTNFWGGTKEDDCFLAPSFDDRMLEVVAVFGSVQMAASRLINLQHHRIAQCQSVQINILGDEGVPIQVDGEAWVQPPGMIRIIHKNRAQMLCRNRSLELSLKSWQEKQRQHSISISREQTSTISDTVATSSNNPSGLFSERETYLLLNFIECASSLVKWVKFLIISHPSLEHDLYAVACRTADALEAIHPHGKIVEGPNLRIQLAELVNACRQLYEDSCELLREREQTLILREDLETKLSVALANAEMELRKCIVNKSADGQMRASLNVLAPNDETNNDSRKKSKPFWMRFRSSGHTSASTSGNNMSTTSTKDTVSNWGVAEVVTWLETMQLGEYVDTFTRNDVRGKELLTLSRRDLKELGIVKVGHVKRILQASKDLNSA